MHHSLLPFVFDELCYITNIELIEKLKESDNYYYLDDINFLSLHNSENVICGFFSECDVAKNFFYAICKENPSFNPPEIRSPSRIVLTCTDFDYLERFLDLFCDKKPPICSICVNLPCHPERMTNLDNSKTVRKNLDILTSKYDNHLKYTSCLYDYRFDCNSPHHSSASSFRIEETINSLSEFVFDIYENDTRIFQYIPNTFSNINSNIPAMRQPTEDRLGMKVVSFSDDIINLTQDEVPNDAIQFCLSAISNIFLKRGYVVKNIALHGQFESEDVCDAIGMKRFRQFVYYKVMF